VLFGIVEGMRLEDSEERGAAMTAKLSALEIQQQERLAQRRARKLSLPYMELFAFPIEPAALSLVPRATAQATGAVVFYKRGRDIRAAAVNPADTKVQAVLADVERRLGTLPAVSVISEHSLQFALSRYPRESRGPSGPRDELPVAADLLTRAAAELQRVAAAAGGPLSLSPTELLTIILAGALQMRATDIHLEPGQTAVQLRYRIDGVLQPIITLDLDMGQKLLSRIKVLAQLKLNVHAVPQDGSFVVRVGSERTDVRVSVLPGGVGEYIVLRLLSRRDAVLSLDALGMKARDLAVVQAELKQSTGMILSTGPTGSGKTTTIATCLTAVNQPGLKVVSLEDPIEYRLAGVEQTEVDAPAGYTFAAGLRSILRQDPDIIFVGEIRDGETAETSVHAALTGHLVFTTLHTNDAPGAILRLREIGLALYVLAPAINLVIAQRLVRVLCPDCAKSYRPDARLREHIRDVMAGVDRTFFDPSVLDDPALRFRKSSGCRVCVQTGFRGRTGVFEVFSVHDEIEQLILAGADVSKIREAAIRSGMTTIAQDAYLKVLDGITTVEEVARISEE